MWAKRHSAVGARRAASTVAAAATRHARCRRRALRRAYARFRRRCRRPRSWVRNALPRVLRAARMRARAARASATFTPTILPLLPASRMRRNGASRRRRLQRTCGTGGHSEASCSSIPTFGEGAACHRQPTEGRPHRPTPCDTRLMSQLAMDRLGNGDWTRIGRSTKRLRSRHQQALHARQLRRSGCSAIAHVRRRPFEAAYWRRHAVSWEPSREHGRPPCAFL